MESLKDQMQDLYVKKQYSELQEMMLKNKDEFSEGQFFYNYGTLFLKQGKIGPARYNFEKAFNIGWYSSGLQKNYEQIIKSVKVDPIKSSFVYDKSIALLELSPWWVFIVIFLLLLNFILLFLSRKALSIRSALIFIILVSLTTGTLLWYKSNLIGAIVLRDAVIKEGPSKIY